MVYFFNLEKLIELEIVYCKADRLLLDEITAHGFFSLTTGQERR